MFCPLKLVIHMILHLLCSPALIRHWVLLRKSTLIKLLAGELRPLAGERQPAQELRIGYFAQHQLDQLRPDQSPLQHLQRLDPAAREQSLRNYVGGFGFSGEAADQPAAPFSGGEKARLVLALLVYQRPNLLLLDEPTNHLDLEMRHSLVRALQGFDGAMVIVSHDRHLLRSSCDRLLLVHDGHIDEFQEALDDYPRWLAEQRTLATPPVEQATVTLSAADRKAQKRRQADRRRQLQPLRQRLRELEQQLEQLATQQQRLEQQLSDPVLYAAENKAALRQLLGDKASTDRALEEAETEWLQAGEALEGAEADHQ